MSMSVSGGVTWGGLLTLSHFSARRRGATRSMALQTSLMTDIVAVAGVGGAMSVPVVRHCGSWCQSWLSECQRESRHVTLMTPWQTRLRVLPKLTESDMDSALTTLLTLPLALALAHSRPPPYIERTLTHCVQGIHNLGLGSAYILT